MTILVSRRGDEARNTAWRMAEASGARRRAVPSQSQRVLAPCTAGSVCRMRSPMMCWRPRCNGLVMRTRLKPPLGSRATGTCTCDNSMGGELECGAAPRQATASGEHVRAVAV